MSCQLSEVSFRLQTSGELFIGGANIISVCGRAAVMERLCAVQTFSCCNILDGLVQHFKRIQRCKAEKNGAFECFTLVM